MSAVRRVGDARPGPDWATRLRRAICGLGLAWLVVGAGITIYHLTTSGAAGTDRGPALMILGAATFSLGIIFRRPT
jgi:hypothetical protein